MTTAVAGEEGRTAVVLRTWDNYNYTESRRAWLRAFIAETALHSGGSHEVFLLVNVKDGDIRLDSDEDAYARTLRDSVPAEFRDMALLYNSRVLGKYQKQVNILHFSLRYRTFYKIWWKIKY